ncbi:TetR/AcrR family transcriptional regulator [Fulvivirgaceae bacterium PWU5]|uniref:TetR/AcrR family transcriptional regulator n=1 Tax=Dawidia cretensis TaxID=2782350 RepID=A0AAP2DXQ4_9BACT|nr:TetR/AcrR family transcriptional regulator [Dawidia cretensis]MBT1709313.1 TetR/AcrR family transcriptional regulator [Dawidia cretensis]
MTKAERTRQFIIEQTAPLFNSKGYDGTTLTDLMDSTGLSKGALYGNFRDKDEIALAAFHYAIDTMRTRLRDELEQKNTYKKQLIALFDFFGEYVFNPPIAGGCPLLNTAVEADDHRISMRRLVARELVETVEFIASLIEKGIESGEFKKGTDAHQMAYVFFCSIEGAVMFARAERSEEPMQIVIKHCKNLVKQISN